MTKLITLITAIGILVSTSPVSAIDTNDVVSASAAKTVVVEETPTSHTIIGARRGQAATIEWALGRYVEAGLELPALTIEVHGDQDGCQGERGLYRWSESLNRIDMCTDNLYVLLHEIAHAWEVSYATDSARDAYAASIGLDSWRSDDVEWGDQASERAANSIAWGLLPRPLSPSDAAATQDMINRYEMLTGSTSPRVSS